jgi:hypothetical protein
MRRLLANQGGYRTLEVVEAERKRAVETTIYHHALVRCAQHGQMMASNACVVIERRVSKGPATLIRAYLFK